MPSSSSSSSSSRHSYHTSFFHLHNINSCLGDLIRGADPTHDISPSKPKLDILPSRWEKDISPSKPKLDILPSRWEKDISPSTTNQSEPEANNNAIKSQPNIKVEPHEEQFDGRCRDESALKGIVKVEHEPHYGAVKLEAGRFTYSGVTTVVKLPDFGWSSPFQLSRCSSADRSPSPSASFCLVKHWSIDFLVQAADDGRSTGPVDDPPTVYQFLTTISDWYCASYELFHRQ
ncbi:hypothetical protein GPALN_004171 [Globodera pallida]|nr:hypothetical protein GPALN_004171 [Globodera pallida]